MKTLTDYDTFAGAASTTANPFPGLRSFDVWENHLFFGREGQVDSLLWKLGRNHFIAVVGASGSGKSSLVRAGLLPVLMGGFEGHAGSAWRIAVMRPGNNPIHNLAFALNAEDVLGSGDPDAAGATLAIAEATLHSSSLGLVQLVRQARMARDENLLVVVDQFEELFRFKENVSIDGAADQASAFVRLLLECVAQREAPIYVALTLRSDFLGDCSQFRDLPEAINEGQYLVPRLRREQVRSAIIGPVAVGGGKIAPRLTQRLLNDVGDNPDQLPILQHALMRAWDQWTMDHEEGEPIDLRHYEAIGGMRKALSQHADEAYRELSDGESRRVCETLFKALTEQGSDNRGIRRPTRVDEICACAGVSVDDVIDVADIFRRPGRTFIMPPHNVALAGDSVLDISHESLMRVWERLDQWVDEEAQSAQMYNRIVESALLYEGGQAGLWRDPDLQIAEEWRARAQPNEPWAARYNPAFASAVRFLERSIQLRRDDRREQLRRKRVAQVFIATFLVCATALTVWAMHERATAQHSYASALAQREIATIQKAEAVRQRNSAELQRKSAERNRRLAEEQRQQADTQRGNALHQRSLAEQQRKLAMDQRQRAEVARKDALTSRDIAESQRSAAVEQKRIAESERARAVVLADGVSRARLLSVAQGLARTVQLGKVDQPELNALLALQAFAFNQANGGYDRDPDVYGALFSASQRLDAGVNTHVARHLDAVRTVTYSPDGLMLVSAGDDGQVMLWNTRAPGSPTASVVQHQFAIRSVAFDPTGKKLAYVGGNGGVRVIDNLQRPVSRVVAALPEPVLYQVAWLDGSRLATVGATGSIHIVNTITGLVERRLSGPAPIRAFAISNGGERIAAGMVSGDVAVWARDGIDAPPTLQKILTGRITAIALSKDGRWVAVGSDDGAVRLRSLASAAPSTTLLSGHRSTVNGVGFGPDGRLLASVSSDGTLRLWDLARMKSEPTIVHRHTSWVWALAISPSGSTVATAGNDRAIDIQPTRPEEFITMLQDHVTRNMSRREWDQYIGPDIGYQRTVATRSDGDQGP